MARTLAVALAFTTSLPLAAVPRPKMDMCSMRSLVAESTAFRATWTRENEFVEPVESVVMSATFSSAGRILTPPMRLTAPQRLTRGVEDQPRSGARSLDVLARERFKDHFLTIRWEPPEVIATVRDVDGRLLSETRLTKTEAGTLPPEFLISDAGESGAIAWLQRAPGSWTTHVAAAIVKSDGVVEVVTEPVLTAAKGIGKIAIAWNGQHHFLAGLFERPPDTPEAERLFVMRLDASMKPTGAVRTVPGTKRSNPSALFLAVLDETVALGWDEASPHVAIAGPDGRVSNPVDLHPDACRAMQFR